MFKRGCDGRERKTDGAYSLTIGRFRLVLGGSSPAPKLNHSLM